MVAIGGLALVGCTTPVGVTNTGNQTTPTSTSSTTAPVETATSAPVETTTTTAPAVPDGGRLVDLGRNLSPYIKLAGDQVITVPNGTYTAGTVSAPHAATAGPEHGWLVLEAQSPYGVVVDLSKAPLTLDKSTSHVMFVGFKFVNGSVFAYGSDITFWYTDHTFPADVWVKQAPNPKYPEQGLYRAPRTVYTNTATSHRVSFYGSDVHDTATAFLVSMSDHTMLEGVSIWNLSDMGVDPQDVVHPDAIGGAVGGTTGLTVRDSWIKGRVMIEDAPGNGGSPGGPFDDFLFDNSWVSNSPSSGFTFTAAKTTSPRGVFGTLNNVRSWANHNGYARIDQIDGKQYYTPNKVPSRVDVPQTLSTDPPSPSDPGPAARSA